MGHLSKNMMEGEEIVFEGKPHWIIFWPLLFVVVISLISLMSIIFSAKSFTDFIGSVLALLAFDVFIGGILLLIGYIQYRFTEYVVTNKRVSIKYGIIARKTFELMITKVESVDVIESIFGRILGYGTVVIRGTGGNSQRYGQVGKHMEFRHAVNQQIDKIGKSITRD